MSIVKSEALNYKNLVFKWRQTSTDIPVFVDASGNNNPLENTLGQVPVWGRTSAGIYTLTGTGSIFDKYRLWISTFTQQSTSSFWFSNIHDGTGVLVGHLYMHTNDNVITIRVVDVALNPVDLSTLVPSGNPLTFPEIRVYTPM